MIRLSADSERLLVGIHPDLVKVIRRAAAISNIPFKVTEGLRTLAQQKKNVASGVSWTLNSRHLTGHAVDLVPIVDVNVNGKIETSEMYAWPVYYRLAPIIKQAAKDVGVPIEWGGDWSQNKDGPHWQLPFKKYPISKAAPAEIKHVAIVQPPATEKTEKQVATTKATAIGVAGLSGAGGTAVQPLADIATAVSVQQAELSSGDWVRIGIAVLILGLTLFGIWRTLR